MSSADADELKALWDPSFRNILSMVEEFEEPLIGLNAVSRECEYYSAIITDGECTFRDPVIGVFGDYAFGFCTTVLKVRVLGKPELHEYVTRNSFVLRRVGRQWKLILFHESGNPLVGPHGRTAEPHPIGQRQRVHR